MPLTVTKLAGLLLISLLVCACERSSEDSQQSTVSENTQAAVRQLPQSHWRMLAILAGIKDRSPEEHLYFDWVRLQKMKQTLATLGPGVRNQHRFQVLSQLGFTELRSEETPRPAIEHLTQAYDLLSQIDFDDAKTGAFHSTWTKFILATAYLRLGETENCCLRYSSDSCILPIRGGGLHTQQEGSRQAIKFFLEILDDTSGSTDIEQNIRLRERARWLLNIAYMTLGEYPDQVPEKYRIPPEFFESEVEFPRFENVAPKLGLDTFNLSGGAIIDDFDNDDYLDIFTTTSDPAGQTRFFRNNRDGTFTDRTTDAGLAGLYGGLNVVQADYNNDGNLDLYIMRGAWLGESGRHPNSLLKNQGDGTFVDVTFEAGLGEVHNPGKTAAWGDFDNDGDLDLFVGNEAQYDLAMTHRFRRTRPVSAPSQLFRNNGDGSFTDVADSAGVRVETFAMGSVWGDFNQDRFPDLFISGRPTHHLFQTTATARFPT